MNLSNFLIATSLAMAFPPTVPPPSVEAMMAGIDRAASPGCAVGIIEHGRLVFARGYGLADVGTMRPITASTPFNLASMSKAFTAAAIGLLIQENKFSEEDDIRRFLPELPRYPDIIRVRHLLHHTSGLRNHMALAAFQASGHLPTHEQALRLVFRQSAVNFRPGTRHQYESPNYVLLAEIVSRVSGERFDRFLERRIFKPLGMADSGFSSKRLSRAYRPKPGGGYELNEAVNSAFGSSGVLSTVEDFARWLANYDSGQVGGRALAVRMLAPSTLDDGRPLSYGYGLVTEGDYAGVPGLTRVSHGGQTASFRSAFSYFPGQGFGSVVLCNVSNGPRNAEAAITAQWVKAQFPAAAAAPPAPPAHPALDPAYAAGLVGTYYDAEDDDLIQIKLDGGALQILFGGEPFPLTYAGEGLFAVGEFGHLRFDKTANGTVRLTEEVDDQARLSFVRLETTGPAAAAADYAGRYRATDLDGEVAVEDRGSGLALTYGSGVAILEPVAPDSFTGPKYDFSHVTFTRDGAGRIDGLSLTVSSGITRMRFNRL